jgi:hypothetical protein
MKAAADLAAHFTELVSFASCPGYFALCSNRTQLNAFVKTVILVQREKMTRGYISVCSDYVVIFHSHDLHFFGGHNLVVWAA